MATTIRMVASLAALLLSTFVANAQPTQVAPRSAPLAVALGSAFSYQGRLNVGGSVANASYDFQFTLYDALSSGVVVAGPVTKTGVVVTGGLFTVELDFGVSAFSGNALWLLIAVRPAGSGGYQDLTPRQPLNPTPYAHYSKAGVATDVVCVGCVQAGEIGAAQVVKSLNGLKDAVTLAPGGGNVTITPSGSTITISAATATLALPYSGTVSAPAAPAFAITNSSTGVGIQAGAANQPGVYGTSTNSRGVYGVGGAYGVYGESANEAVHGQGGTTGVLGQGATYGVYALGGGYGAYAQGTISGLWAKVTTAGSNAGFFEGNVYATGTVGSGGAVFFIEPHPTDPEKEIRFDGLEGPESGTYFRGSARTVDGRAAIEVPESFRLVTDRSNLTVVLTPIGELAILACVEKTLDRIVVRSSQDVEFDYVVHGVRKAFKDHVAISANTHFRPRSASDTSFTTGLPAESIRRLKASGILDEDGSLRLDTAERLGWSRTWEDARAPRSSDRSLAADR